MTGVQNELLLWMNAWNAWFLITVLIYSPADCNWKQTEDHNFLRGGLHEVRENITELECQQECLEYVFPDGERCISVNFYDGRIFDTSICEFNSKRCTQDNDLQKPFEIYQPLWTRPGEVYLILSSQNSCHHGLKVGWLNFTQRGWKLCNNDSLLIIWDSPAS